MPTCYLLLKTTPADHLYFYPHFCSMMKPVMFSILLLCATLHCFSQFNDSTHYRFRYLGTGSLNKTKTAKAYLLSNGASFDVSKPKIALNSSVNWIYGQQNNVLSNNDFSAGANLDFRKSTNALYYWSLINYQSSYSLKINYKLQAGGGIGFTILDEPKQQLSLSDGLLYEANNLTDASLGQDVYSTVRNSFRLKYKFVVNDIVSFNGTDFVQPSLLSLDDYILSFRNDVSIKLRQWLSLNAALNYNRINRTGRENLLLTFGVSVDKYF